MEGIERRVLRSRAHEAESKGGTKETSAGVEHGTEATRLDPVVSSRTPHTT